MAQRRSSRKTTFGAGMAGMCLAIVLMLGMIGWMKAWPDTAPAPDSSMVASNARVTQVTVPWYFKNDQWRADMRTLEGILRYLTDSAELAETNSATGRTGDV